MSGGEDLPVLRTTGLDVPRRAPRRPRLKSPGLPFAIVVWNDAHSNGGLALEFAVEDIDHKPAIYYTAGWILKDDDTGLSIANEWDPNDNKFRGVTFIPRGMVVQVSNR